MELKWKLDRPALAWPAHDLHARRKCASFTLLAVHHPGHVPDVFRKFRGLELWWVDVLDGFKLLKSYNLVCRLESTYVYMVNFAELEVRAPLQPRKAFSNTPQLDADWPAPAQSMYKFLKHVVCTVVYEAPGLVVALQSRLVLAR